MIPFKYYEKVEMKTLLNVKRVNIKVDFVDYDVMLMLNKLDQIEKVYNYSIIFYYTEINVFNLPFLLLLCIIFKCVLCNKIICF